MNALQTSLSNLRNYIYQPTYQSPLSESFDKQSSATIRQFLAEYPLMLTLLFVSVSSFFLSEFVTGENLCASLLQRSHVSPVLVLVTLPVVILLEELIFRSILFLTPKRLKGLMILLLYTPFYYYVRTSPETTNEWTMLGIFAIWFITLFLVIRYLKRPAVYIRINTFWQTNFRWIFYGLTFLYAIRGVDNQFDMVMGWRLVLLPVLLLASLLGGFYFGYLRMKYGFWYAVVVHSVIVMVSLAPEMIRTL